MGQLAVPMMIGAAVGGGSKLLQGKGVGGILKGAALGGALGGATGGVSNLLGSAAATATPSLAPEALAGTIESSGMVFNPATGSYLAPEAYLSASSANPIYTGGSMLNALPDAMSIDNLKGAAMVANMYQPTPTQSAPAGRIEVGQAPTGAIYDALRQTGYTLPKRRETNFSLLG